MHPQSGRNVYQVAEIDERLKGLGSTIKNIDTLVGALNSNQLINWYRPLLALIMMSALCFLLWFAYGETFNASVDRTQAAIFFGVSIQAVTAVIAVSLLLIRQDILSDEDQVNLAKIAGEIASIRNDLTKIDEKKSKSDFALADQEILKLEMSVKRLEFLCRGWKITWPRAGFGLMFALIFLRVSSLPIHYPSSIPTATGAAQTPRPTQALGPATNPSTQAHITYSYGFLASISCACAAASFAMLGRRKTDEQKFLGDFMQVNGTLRAISETVSQAAKLPGS